MPFSVSEAALKTLKKERGTKLNTQCIREKFEQIGARVKFSELTAKRDVDVSSSVVVDVLSDKKGQIYDISILIAARTKDLSGRVNGSLCPQEVWK